MQKSIYERAAEGKAIGSAELIYGKIRATPEELRELNKNRQCEITEDMVKETIEDLIYLGAEPTEEDKISLICAKGLLEFDAIKRRILAHANIQENNPKWIKAYNKRIAEIEQRGVVL